MKKLLFAALFVPFVSFAQLAPLTGSMTPSEGRPYETTAVFIKCPNSNYNEPYCYLGGASASQSAPIVQNVQPTEILIVPASIATTTADTDVSTSTDATSTDATSSDQTIQSLQEELIGLLNQLITLINART